jgi:DNA-directed RNA polymerase sigma subunit (sigma70/sigma32)
MANKELSLSERKALAKKLDNVVSSARSKKMFRFRYGLDDGISKSNALVGKRFKVSREAVRQTIKKIEALFETK